MPKAKTKKNNTELPRFQLCITCRKATGGCAWSDNLQPVKGWKATPTKVSGNKGGAVESYSITACPEYEDDVPLEELHTDGVINLMQAHLTRSIQEYIWAVQKYERACDLGSKDSTAALDAKKTVTLFEQFVLPKEIAETALRLYHNGEYDPDKVPKRTKLSKGE